MPNRITTEIFINRARKIHGSKYDYSKVEYNNSKSKLLIICPIHGAFYQTAKAHLRGRGCHKCGGSFQYTTETFIQAARKIHGDFFNYSEVDYKNAYSSITVICPVHGPFLQKPAAHLQGQGCFKCAVDAKSLTTEKFIKKAKEVHKNKYDYSKVNYKNNYTKIEIICPEHGPFQQYPINHLRGHGCKSCVGLERLTTKEFIRRAREVHGYKFDYSKTIYTNAETNVIIICPIHGEFTQMAYNHLTGRGCLKCAFHEKKSKGEKELCNYIRSLYSGKIIENDRIVIKPKELDIYLPELKLALEYNGEYWHKIHEEKEPGYHENKRQLCKDAGITLIEIWENKWKTNAEIIKKEISKHLQKAREKL